MNQQDRKRLIEIAAALANGAPLAELFALEEHAALTGRKTIRHEALTDDVNAAHSRLQDLSVELRGIADRAQQESK